MIWKDIAQYNDTDSQLARFTILKQQEKINNVLQIIGKIKIDKLPMSYRNVFTEIKQILEEE